LYYSNNTKALFGIPSPQKETQMTPEVINANPGFNPFFDEDDATEEMVNDSLGTTVLADSTGTDWERMTEEDEELQTIGYSTDERQD
jgi:hypothetical protein